jgi:AraC family transcriptional regulator of adaptative response/methylated-DNA-[protein]-cysteine methyltransferase
MISAMQRNDQAYDGKFYIGVLTTGIYCLPSCKAKLPLLRNVTFYPTREAAIVGGLRGCKRCKSDRFPDVMPAWLNPVVMFMNENRALRLNENTLASIAGVNISTIRRYFKQHHQVTPLAFHRKLRLWRARSLIEKGSDYLTAGFDCGYESASGFREAYVREFGCPPGRTPGR